MENKIPAASKKVMILVPDNSKGPYGILYDTAKGIVKTKAIVTTNWRRAIREHESLKKIIIIMGSRGKSLSDTYDTLKKAQPEIKFVLINSFDVITRKKDTFISLATTSQLAEIIQGCL